MEVNCIAEPLSVPESSGTTFQRFNAAVHAFSMAVVDLSNHGVENAPEVLSQGFRSDLHRLEPTTRHPVDQVLPALLCPCAAPIVPQSGSEILDGPRPGGLQ